MHALLLPIYPPYILLLYIKLCSNSSFTPGWKYTSGNPVPVSYIKLVIPSLCTLNISRHSWYRHLLLLTCFCYCLKSSRVCFVILYTQNCLHDVRKGLCKQKVSSKLCWRLPLKNANICLLQVKTLRITNEYRFPYMEGRRQRKPLELLQQKA